MSVYRRDGLPWLSVFLRSAAGAVELSTVDDSTGYKLLDGVKGLAFLPGVLSPPRSPQATVRCSGRSGLMSRRCFSRSV